MSRILFAFVLVCGLAWPAPAEQPKSSTTILIVARPELPDPNFKDSMVLVMNNVGPEPGGVILNRPTRIPVSHLFPDLEGLAHVDDKVYFGGPVQITMVSFLFRTSAEPEDAIKVLDGVYLSTNRELLLKLLARDKPMEGLRIFIGYSGWGPGQLEGEIAHGDWTLEPATAEAIFDIKSQHPWPEEAPPAGARRI